VRFPAEPMADSSTSSMRLDVFLTQSRIIPRRTLAQEVCDQGGILVNGQVAKSARPVKVGDQIEWHQHQKIIVVRVSRIPSIRPGKREASGLYEPLRIQHGERPS